jgi:hypothetical protein
LNQTQYEEFIQSVPGYNVQEEASRSLRFVASHEWQLSAGLIDLAHAGTSNETDMRVAIQGGRARRVEMEM